MLPPHTKFILSMLCHLNICLCPTAHVCGVVRWELWVFTRMWCRLACYAWRCTTYEEMNANELKWNESLTSNYSTNSEYWTRNSQCKWSWYLFTVCEFVTNGLAVLSKAKSIHSMDVVVVVAVVFPPSICIAGFAWLSALPVHRWKRTARLTVSKE